MQPLNKSNTTFIYKTVNLHVKQKDRTLYTTYLFTNYQKNNGIAQRSGLWSNPESNKTNLYKLYNTNTKKEE